MVEYPRNKGVRSMAMGIVNESPSSKDTEYAFSKRNVTVESGTRGKDKDTRVNIGRLIASKAVH